MLEPNDELLKAQKMFSKRHLIHEITHNITLFEKRHTHALYIYIYNVFHMYLYTFLNDKRKLGRKYSKSNVQ